MPEITKQPRVAVYVRVSSEKQDVDISISTQINELNRHATNR